MGDESVANLWPWYQDIQQLFSQELKGPALPYFVDWLLERVAVVEITITDQETALEIFETMNDRGARPWHMKLRIDLSEQGWRCRVTGLAYQPRIPRRAREHVDDTCNPHIKELSCVRSPLTNFRREQSWSCVISQDGNRSLMRNECVSPPTGWHVLNRCFCARRTADGAPT